MMNCPTLAVKAGPAMQVFGPFQAKWGGGGWAKCKQLDSIPQESELQGEW